MLQHLSITSISAEDFSGYCLSIFLFLNSRFRLNLFPITWPPFIVSPLSDVMMNFFGHTIVNAPSVSPQATKYPCHERNLNKGVLGWRYLISNTLYL